MSAHAMEKRRQYRRVFDHFDENGDGKISVGELQRGVETVGGELVKEEAEAAVMMVDSDGDGMLGLEDFVRMVEGPAAAEEEKEKDMMEAFKMYEMEGRGCITPKSLRRMLCRLGEEKTINECKIMISHFDLNGDGVLDFEEFKVMMS
ncbi:hypothetical protein NMG60_11026702 [Bertholletia excelsa]